MIARWGTRGELYKKNFSLSVLFLFGLKYLRAIDSKGVLQGDSELNWSSLLLRMHVSLKAHSQAEHQNQVASSSRHPRHSVHSCQVPNYLFLLASPANVKSGPFRLKYPMWKRNDIFAKHDQKSMCWIIQGMEIPKTSQLCYERETETKLCTLSDAFCESSCSYSFLICSSSALREEFSDLKESARWPSSSHSAWKKVINLKCSNKILLNTWRQL
jgi:hypothetical protein